MSTGVAVPLLDGGVADVRHALGDRVRVDVGVELGRDELARRQQRVRLRDRRGDVASR